MRIKGDREPMTISDSEPVNLGEAKGPQVALVDNNIDPIINWPPKITLKADNGKYLSRMGDRRCEPSKSEPDRFCVFQVEVIDEAIADRSIALKGDNGRYLSRWGGNGGTPYAYFAKDQIDPFCVFRYYSLPDNKIALKGDNNWFLSRFTKGGHDIIVVGKGDIDKFCKFTVGEYLVKREITDIEYDLDTASIKEEEALVTETSDVHNSGNNDIIKTLKYKHTKSVVGTWNNEIGISVGVETEFQTGIPYIVEGKIKVKFDASYKHSWGGSEGETHEIEDSTEVHVGPKTSLKVQVVVKRARIDVNFTYIIKRLLPDGTVEIQDGLKGVYRNIDSYDSVVDIFEEPYRPVS